MVWWRDYWVVAFPLNKTSPLPPSLTHMAIAQMGNGRVKIIGLFIVIVLFRWVEYYL